MAEKRTTPEANEETQQEAAHGPRRKKRASPTIDLTATEVKSAVDEPQPQQDSEQAKSSIGRETPSDIGKNGLGGNPWNWLSNNINAPTLAAGVVGAAMVTVILFALWLTGLVPIRYAGSTAMRARVTGLELQMHDLQNRPAGAIDTKSIDALNDRFAKIEDGIAKLPPGDAGVAERLAATDNALKALGVALAALNRRSDDIAGNAALARDRAAAAEKAVAELHASVQDATKNASSGISSVELDALQKRIASASDKPARLALSATVLRDAVMSGAPFAAELAQLKSLGADEKSLATLEPFAATGMPAPAALANELRALIPAMLKVSGAQAPAGGFLDRLQANAGKLVRISPVDAPPGDDPTAVLARIEIDAANANIAAALVDFDKLNDAIRAPAQAWIVKARARQAALATARQIATDTARALGPQ